MGRGFVMSARIFIRRFHLKVFLKETNKGIFELILIWLIWFLFQKERVSRTSSQSSSYLSKHSIIRQLNNQWNMEFIFQISRLFDFLVYWFQNLKFWIYLFPWGVYSFKYESQINQKMVLFISIDFFAVACVISDILIECIGFLGNFTKTKLLEKSFGTTYFINKIEKTFISAALKYC